jgi:glutathione S-transferase
MPRARARYRLQAMLNFTTSEVHKPFAPLFKADTSAERRQKLREALALRLPPEGLLHPSSAARGH